MSTIKQAVNSSKLAKKKQFDLENKKRETKKIGFLGGVAFIISAVIGVGIFLKNGQILTFNLGNFSLSLSAWLLSSLAVISLGLSLIVIGAKTRSELGILQWAKDFCTPYIFQMIKAYFIFLYIPLIVCGDTFYFLQSLQQAFPVWKLAWYVPWLVAIGVLLYFSVANTLSQKLVVFHAKFSFYLKLFPIFFFCFVAFILYGMNYDGVRESAVEYTGFIHANKDNIQNIFYSNPMLLYGPEIGFFASIPPMFFAFDGFYYVISIQDQLKDKKKTPWIMLIGILCVVAIFLLITISLILSTSFDGTNAGSMMGVKYLYSSPAWRAVNSVLNIMICIGCLGIVSSSINFASSLYKELGLTYELPFFEKLLKKGRLNQRQLSLIYLFSYLGFFVILICIIGTFGFMNLDNYNFGFAPNDRIDELYSFINTVTNWESLFTFASFVFIIGGSWVAVKQHKITFKKKVRKTMFLLEGVFAFLLIGIAVLFAVIITTGDLILVCIHPYFYDQNCSFYALSNLDGTKITIETFLANHQTVISNYIASYNAQTKQVLWHNVNNGAALTLNSKFILSYSSIHCANNTHPLFALIYNNSFRANNAKIVTLSGAQIMLYSNYMHYLFSGHQSLFGQLNQDFIARIINFGILIMIQIICVSYARVNLHWLSKKRQWFWKPENIFHQKEFEIHFDQSQI